MYKPYLFVGGIAHGQTHEVRDHFIIKYAKPLAAGPHAFLYDKVDVRTVRRGVKRKFSIFVWRELELERVCHDLTQSVESL